MMKNAFYFILKSFHSRDIFKNHAENEAVRLVPNLMLLFLKKLYMVKASGLQLCFNIFRTMYFDSPQLDIK